MKTSKAENWLSLFLLLTGITMLCALIAALMPFSWMNFTHELIGMGKLPHSPVMEYLARTISVLYAIIGGFSIILSTNIKSYRPLIVYFAWIHIIMAILYIGIDYIANLPTWWIILEGPTLFLMGIIMLYLLRISRLPETQDDSNQAT